MVGLLTDRSVQKVRFALALRDLHPVGASMLITQESRIHHT